ncbi:MAG: FAD-dependent oxidoreductase, partial [Bacteroidota bacterium]
MPPRLSKPRRITNLAIAAVGAVLLLAMLLYGGRVSNTHAYDVVIYGATAAGLVAAIEADRQGKTVALIEPTSRIGGLTTGGLGQTDIGNKRVIGGLARSFYERIKKHYADSSGWKWQPKATYRPKKNTRSEDGESAMWTFEPSAALRVL